MMGIFTNPLTDFIVKNIRNEIRKIKRAKTFLNRSFSAPTEINAPKIEPSAMPIKSL